MAEKKGRREGLLPDGEDRKELDRFVSLAPLQKKEKVSFLANFLKRKGTSKKGPADRLLGFWFEKHAEGVRVTDLKGERKKVLATGHVTQNAKESSVAGASMCAPKKKGKEKKVFTASTVLTRKKRDPGGRALPRGEKGKNT